MPDPEPRRPEGPVDRIVVLGEAARVRPFGLAGATVLVAEGPEGRDRALDRLPAETRLLILTQEAAAQLGPRLEERSGLLVAVLPG